MIDLNQESKYNIIRQYLSNINYLQNTATLKSGYKEFEFSSGSPIISEQELIKFVDTIDYIPDLINYYCVGSAQDLWWVHFNQSYAIVIKNINFQKRIVTGYYGNKITFEEILTNLKTV